MKKVGTKKSSNIWFPAKKYGYGWGMPVVWQGWVVLLGTFAVGCAPLFYVSFVYKGDEYCREVIEKGIPADCNPEVATSLYLLAAIAWLIASVMALYIVCEKKGEKPSWRWGKAPKKHAAKSESDS